jgi:hypothetical protein
VRLRTDLYSGDERSHIHRSGVFLLQKNIPSRQSLHQLILSQIKNSGDFQKVIFQFCWLMPVDM